MRKRIGNYAWEQKSLLLFSGGAESADPSVDNRWCVKKRDGEGRVSFPVISPPPLSLDLLLNECSAGSMLLPTGPWKSGALPRCSR